MKATIERAVLLKSLGHVQSVVERRNTIPILSNVLIEADSTGQLKLMATDLDLQVVETIAAKVETPGTTTVDGTFPVSEGVSAAFVPGTESRGKVSASDVGDEVGAEAGGRGHGPIIARGGLQRVDEHLVLVADVAAADLVGSGQLAVVGIQFFVQHQKAADLAAGQQRVFGQVGIDLFDALLDQLVHLGFLGQVGVACIGQVLALGPVAHGVEVDVDHHADQIGRASCRERVSSPV